MARKFWGKKRKGPVGAALIVLEGPDKGEEFPIADEVTIGRTQDNSLIRLERGVSRRHCSIRDEGGVYTLEDKGSSNGTIINEMKITGLEVLRHGDRIIIGETTFLFHWPDGQIETGLDTSPGIGVMSEDTQPSGKRPRDVSSFIKKPSVIIAIVVVGLLIVGGLVGLSMSGHQPLGPSNLSEEPIRYSDTSDFRQTAFGMGNHDDAHPDKAIIVFDFLKGRATLRYSAWGINQTGDVIIKLNGKTVGDVPATEEYRHELFLELPMEHLTDGQNELVFDNTNNPPGEDTWEVGYVRIVHEPILPPNPDAAQSHYQQGLRFYEDREVDPANRFRAFEKFRMTRNLLEQADPKPSIYDESKAMTERVTEELQQIFQLGQFSAERAYRFGDVDEARGYLHRTLRYFPDPDDVRRDQLARALEGLEGQ